MRAFALLAVAGAVLLTACSHGSAGSGLSGLPPQAGSRAPLTVSATAAPSPIVYVSGNDRINVFDLAASGTASPQRTIFANPAPTSGLIGVATNRDQTLDVLQAYHNASGNFSDCRLFVEASNANGSATETSENECYGGSIGTGVTGVRGLAITRGPNSAPSEVDYLESLLGTQFPGDVVQRYSGGYTSYIQLPGPPRSHNGIAEASGGHIYVSSSLTALQGPAFPPPGPTNPPSPAPSNPPTVTYSGTGTAQSAGGHTTTYSNISTNASTLYWGPGYAPPDLYFTSTASPAPMTYSASGSNLPNGIERWTGSDSGLMTRLTLTVKDPSSAPIPLQDLGSPDIGPIASLAGLTGFSANILFEVSNDNGSTWTASGDYYTAHTNPHPGDGSTDQADFSGAFYYQNKAPIVTSTSTTTCDTTPGIARIDNYAVGTSNPANLITHTMTITGRTAAGTLAVSPDLTALYAVTCDASGNLYIDTLNPQASGPTSPTRSLGPFGNTEVLALAVDLAGNLYAGLTDNPVTTNSNTHLRVYAPGGASGHPTPLRILQNPVAPPNQKITGIAITQ